MTADSISPRFLLSAAAAAGLLLSTAACTPVGVAVGAGATGAVTASQERGIEGGASDTQIRAAINYMWLEYSATMYRQLNLQIWEGRVLLTGVIGSEEWRAQAVKLAWQAKGVKEVIDETVVDKSGSTGSFVRDQWITGQLKSKLLFEKNVFSVNYSFETVRGVIYMIGVAQDQQELEIVLNHARNIEYVQRVVNHVLLKSDPRRANNGNQPQGQPGAQSQGGTSTGGSGAPMPAEPAGGYPVEGGAAPAPRSGGITTEQLN
ncbi:MAG TPA: BON domain-containing protein [Alphaproteobacteria bacterium]|nr:BON domain-containing protein [Alphaproteobacteria bacterium]